MHEVSVSESTEVIVHEVSVSESTEEVVVHEVSVSESTEEVKRQQESLQRCQSLEETQRLYDSGQHQQVVDSLTATFASMQPAHRGMKVCNWSVMLLLC